MLYGPKKAIVGSLCGFVISFKLRFRVEFDVLILYKSRHFAKLESCVGQNNLNAKNTFILSFNNFYLYFSFG